MDFFISPEDERLRRELREFLRRELPPGFQGPTTLGDGLDLEVASALKRKLAQRGWLALGWPREYGGLGASQVTQAVYNEEMVYNRAPGIDAQGVKQLGPVLMRFGTQEQRDHFLPRIARAEMEWCQGYSEPGSGSDLASVQTRAVEDGDDFVISGTKTWTSRAHRADWMYLLARTNPEVPKHRGISFLLCDMKSPGITVRPIINMLGVHYFNEVHLDNVRVPKSNLVGERDRGWYVAATLLDLERSGVEYPAQARRTLDDLVCFVRDTVWTSRPLARHPLVRHRLANGYVETEVGRLLAYRVAWLQSQGQVPNREASLSKLFGTELVQRVSQDGMRILGLAGQLGPEDPRAPLQGALQRMYMASLSPTIGAGASEIQRNIIATRGLGLPRG